MAMTPRLEIRQSQSLVMTPQLQQAIKLLTLSNLEIETFIGEALESNPLLEAGDVRRDAATDEPDNTGDTPNAEPTADSEASGETALDMASGIAEQETDTGDGFSGPEWGSAGTTYSDEDPSSIDSLGSAQLELSDHLRDQVVAQAGNAQEAHLASLLIGYLDEAGYLETPLETIASEFGVALPEIERALSIIHLLEPTGVGARNLGECLALQAREADRYDPCMARMIDNLDLLAKGEFARLKRICGVDDEDFADMLNELRSYNPKPGLSIGGGAENAIQPDILLRENEKGEWSIRLNEATLPRLVVNRQYYVDLQHGCTDKESRTWLNEKLADANWLIKALDQRQKTILKTTAEIVKHQDGFFRRGVSELKPLTLREVAEAIDMHESTISRVTSNKYIHCAMGTFELKYFFTSGVTGSDGEGASSEAVKSRIKALTDAEDAKSILSDDKLVKMLQDEGFAIARRTVAKYREAMGIGSSVQRRKAKRLANL